MVYGPRYGLHHGFSRFRFEGASARSEVNNVRIVLIVAFGYGVFIFCNPDRQARHEFLQIALHPRLELQGHSLTREDRSWA